MAATAPPAASASVRAWTAEELRDWNDVMRHCAVKGLQMGALITPPVALVYTVYKRRFGVARLLRNSALGTIVVGAPSGLLAGWGRMRNMEPEAVGDRAFRIRHNASQRRCDDYSAVGGVLGALLTTTVFLRRASVFSTMLGGGALGMAGGVLVHLAQSRRDGSTLSPDAMIAEIKEGPPAGKLVQDVQKKPEEVLKGR